MMETETRLKHEYDLALTAARRELIQSLAAFQSHRADYFHDMEHEVVRLALAISRTVIERELEINPTLLEAAARDVLQRIEAGSKIRLRVPTTDVSAWQASLAMEVDRGIRVEILGDDKAICGQCIVETGLGTTEFNIAERLREIEATLLQCSPGDDASRTRPVLVQ
jgi:flagellar biosynthesis/type III secretory pathway protein FliH